MTLTVLCDELHNYFETERIFGDFTIENHGLEEDVLSHLQDGQYFRIVGSVFNEGVFQFKDGSITPELKDETFHGAIWPMAVPLRVISLVDDISVWEEANKDVVNSPYRSEAFGGYSYTRVGKSINGTDYGVLTWQMQFERQMNRWRKVKCHC